MLRSRSLLSLARLFFGFLSPRCHGGRNWSDALLQVQSGEYVAVSMDCFDTILARGVPDWEQHVLAETVAGEAGRTPNQAREDFDLARKQATRLATGDEEPTARSIWTQYCKIAGIPEQAEQLCAHELKLLEMTSTASADALNFIATVQTLDLPWIICTDTRWSASLLSDFMRRKGIAIGAESIFSSSDHRRSKFRGGLYSIAHQHLGKALRQEFPPSKILHIGNSFFADNCSAACFGMRTVRVPAASLKPEQVPAAETISSYLELVRRDLALGSR